MRHCVMAMALVALVACDDGGDGGSGFSSGVETEKTIASLSDAEAQTVCDAMAAAGASLVSQDKICELIGVAFAPSPDVCRQSIGECKAELAMNPPEEDEGECRLADPALRAGCDRTVAELEGCMSAVFAKSRSLLGQISCNDAGNQARLESLQSQVPEGPQDIPDCAAINDACPQLFEAEDGEVSDLAPPGE